MAAASPSPSLAQSIMPFFTATAIIAGIVVFTGVWDGSLIFKDALGKKRRKFLSNKQLEMFSIHRPTHHHIWSPSLPVFGILLLSSGQRLWRWRLWSVWFVWDRGWSNKAQVCCCPQPEHWCHFGCGWQRDLHGKQWLGNSFTDFETDVWFYFIVLSN